MPYQDVPGIVANYTELLREKGSGAEAVQWADEASQRARFEVLSKVDPTLASVLDVGCGLADFLLFLREKGLTTRYTGVDIVPEFVDLANRTLENDDQAEALLLDAGGDDLPNGHDFAILSGAFNNAMPDNWGFMTTTLRKMYDAADVGIAFNAMSTWVDFQDPKLWYVDPMEVFAFCKRDLGGHPVLRHDYSTRDGGYPFEFAMYVYKEPLFPLAPK